MDASSRISEDLSSTSPEFRRELLKRFSKNGLLQSTRTRLRTQLLEELYPNGEFSICPEPELLWDVAVQSVVAGHLQSTDCEYTRSVFLPEARMERRVLTNVDDVLRSLQFPSPFIASVEREMEEGKAPSLLHAILGSVHIREQEFEKNDHVLKNQVKDLQREVLRRPLDVSDLSETRLSRSSGLNDSSSVDSRLQSEGDSMDPAHRIQAMTLAEAKLKEYRLHLRQLESRNQKLSERLYDEMAAHSVSKREISRLSDELDALKSDRALWSAMRPRTGGSDTQDPDSDVYNGFFSLESLAREHVGVNKGQRDEETLVLPDDDDLEDSDTRPVP